MSYLSHLERSECGQTANAHELHNLCSKCSAPLWVRYDRDRGWLRPQEKIACLNTGAGWKNP